MCRAIPAFVTFITTKIDHSPVYVERCDEFWECQILSDGAWNSHLVDAEVGIRRDDGTTREVDALPHQVASDSPLFSLQSLLHRLQRAARFLNSLKWLS